MTYDEGFAAGMRRAAEECHRLAESYTRSLALYDDDDPERRKIKWGAAAVTVAAENILAAIPAAATAQCCMCGKRDLSTVEDGGPECELHDGRWVCSRECYDRAIPATAPWTPPPEAERPDFLACLGWALDEWLHIVWLRGQWLWAGTYDVAVTPTHFAPLPPAPEDAT